MDRPHRNKALLFVLPALIILMFSFVVPFMAVVNFSFHDVFAGNNFVWAGTHWFQQIMGSPEFWTTLGRTFLYAALVIAIEVPLGVWIALNLPRSGRSATMFVMIAAIPLLIPWFVVGLIWKIFSDASIGPLGSLATAITKLYDLNDPLVAWAVILLADVWHWTGLVVLLCYAGLVAIPQAHYQAALVDGASRTAIFRYVEFPRLKRVLIIALLLRLTDSLMVYIEPFMVTRAPRHLSTS